MLCLGWIFLWLVSGEKIIGFNISDCASKKHIWTYHTGREEKFFLFCDLPEPSKSHFSHGSRLLATHVPPHVPCSGGEDLSDVQWYLQSPNRDPQGEIASNYPHIIQDKTALQFTTIGVNDTGSYICRPRIRNPQDEACCIKIVLEVKPQKNISCVGPISHKQYLLLGSIASIYCPSLSCQHGVQSQEVTWYRNGKLFSNKTSNPIQLNEIYISHQGTYVCDYTQSDNASSWTVRAVVQVQTIVENTNSEPVILEPIKDTLEVELGKPLTLNCRVQFGFEKDFAPVVTWYSQDSNQKLQVLKSEQKSIKSTLKDREIQCVAHLKEVTQRDLHRKFICFAQNSIGNATQYIWLKEKKGGKPGCGLRMPVTACYLRRVFLKNPNSSNNNDNHGSEGLEVPDTLLSILLCQGIQSPQHAHDVNTIISILRGRNGNTEEH